MDVAEPQDELKNNVHYLHSLIDKFVTVNIIFNSVFTGFVHTIDPVSKSIILSIQSGDKSTTTLIPGHAIINISETSTSTKRQPTRKNTNILADEELKDRKNKIMTWLRKNMLPASEESNIIKLGHISILPPYSLNDICSENPIEVIEIRKMVASMPDDIIPQS